MQQSPVDKRVIIFKDPFLLSWITEDCGMNVRAIEKKRVHSFEFHPTQRNWILASVEKNCTNELDDPCKGSSELHISKDLGKTWTYLTDYVGKFAWYRP